MYQSSHEAMQHKRSYENLVLVERALDVLECANRFPVISVKRISSECGIPSASVVRILETLCARGYMRKISRRGGYLLSSRVKALSAGYYGSNMLVELMCRRADALTKAHLWPFSIATLDRDAMVVRYSSIPLSPLAHKSATLHRRLCIFSRAHGIAYAAYCSSRERMHLVRSAIAADSPEIQSVENARQWRAILKTTRERGFALRNPTVDPTTRSIAVPVMAEPGRVLATIGMTYFPRAVRPGQLDVYVNALKENAAAAVRDLARAGNARQAIAAE